MEELSTFINFIGHKALLMTLIPSLFLNVIIDIVKKYIWIKTKNEEKLVASAKAIEIYDYYAVLEYKTDAKIEPMMIVKIKN